MVAEITSLISETNFLNELGPFPILQFWGGLATLGIGVIGAILWVRGARRESTPEENLQHMLRMDGPIAITVRLLERTADALENIRGAVYKIAENGRAQTALLNDIKNGLERRDIRDESRR
jgi:hypothetical protein